MGVLEALRTGQFGISLEIPAHWEVSKESAISAQLLDKERNVVWYFFLFPDQHLDLREEHHADLKKSLEYYARAMFDQVYEQLKQPDQERSPRTADPKWSPMVDAEHVQIGDVNALRTIHRMAYQPGKEMIMGHILVPIRQGLFEARVLCVDQLTGYRESILYMKWTRDRELTEDEINAMQAKIRQADFDDPKHDEGMPQHALSRARAALRWLCLDAKLRVTQLPAPLPEGEINVPDLKCSILPPSRFVFMPEKQSATTAFFRRVSFCGTDGEEFFTIERWDDFVGKGDIDLAHAAKAKARAIHKESGIEDGKLTVKELEGQDKRPQALVFVEGTGHLGLLRNAMLFFQDEHQRLWALSRCGTAAVPRKALTADLTQAAKSLRIHELPPPQPPKKPWWQIW